MSDNQLEVPSTTVTEEAVTDTQQSQAASFETSGPKKTQAGALVIQPSAPVRRPISERKLAANRANAQKSTGPRTPRGKTTSSWNALKHGLLSRRLVNFSDQSQRSFLELLADLREKAAA